MTDSPGKCEWEDQTRSLDLKFRFAIGIAESSFNHENFTTLVELLMAQDWSTKI